MPRKAIVQVLNKVLYDLEIQYENIYSVAIWYLKNKNPDNCIVVSQALKTKMLLVVVFNQHQPVS
jgi:hypothetical protein